MENNKTLKGYDSIFAYRLSLLMQNKGTKQADLADYLGLTRQAISKYTDGSVLPNIENLQKICEYFNVSSDYLIGLSNSDSLITEERYFTDLTGLNSHSIETLNLFISSENKEDKTISKFLDYMLKDRKDLSVLATRFTECYARYVKEKVKKTKADKTEDYTLDYAKLKFITCDWFDEIIDMLVLDLCRENNLIKGD